MSLQGASLQSARGWRRWCPCETRYTLAGNPTFTYFPLRGEGKWKPSQPAAPWMPGVMLLPLHVCPFPLSAVKALSLLLTEEAQRSREVCSGFSRLEETCGHGCSRAPHADAAIAGKRGFPCAAWGGFPLPAILPCRGWLSPQQRNTCCSSAAWRCEMIAGMIALRGQEGVGHRKHLRGKPPKSQGKKWGDSKTADLFSEQWRGVGWVSVPPRDGDSAAGFSYFPTVVQEQFVLINCEK